MIAECIDCSANIKKQNCYTATQRLLTKRCGKCYLKWKSKLREEAGLG